MRKNPGRLWTEAELRVLYERYLAGEFPSGLAKIRGHKGTWLLERFLELGWPLRAKGPRVIPPRIPAAIVDAMYADYQAGMSFADVERKHGRGSKTARNIFLTRDWPVRDPNPNANRHHRADGTWIAYPPKTEEEIEALIQSAPKLAVPAELKLEWRKWSIERRGDFITHLRARIQDPMARPDLPFSSNVTPFDYSSVEAWKIIRDANGNKSSREWTMKMDLISQGVIWDGRLWFWCRQEPYYYEAVKWTPERPRQAIHRAIWESIHGPLGKSEVVRLIDGNSNNLDPSNLTLTDRDNLCRENQAAALTRKSRERTALLLNRHHTPHHEHAETLQNLGSRAR